MGAVLDFSSIPSPILETQDRASELKLRAIGNANLSDIGSFMEGFEKSHTNLSNSFAVQAETRAKFNPDKLAAEQYRRELENQEIERAIDTADENLTILKKTGLAKAQAEVSDIQARAVLNRANATLAQSRAEVAPLEAQASLRTADAKARKAEFEMDTQKIYGPLQAQADVIKSLSTSDSSIREQDRKDQKIYLEQVKERNKNIRIKELGLLDPNKSAEEKAQIRKDISLIPPIEAPPVNREDLVRRQKLTSSVLDINEKLNQIDYIETTSELRRGQEATARKLTELNEQENNRAVSVAARERAKEAIAEKEITGDVNMEALIQPLMVQSQAVKNAKNPTDKDYNTVELVKTIEEAGGAENIVRSLDSIEDDTKKKQLKEVVYSAILEQGDVTTLPDEQLQMATAGLEAKHLADPEGTIENISRLVAGRGADVKDIKLKKLMWAHPYFTAYQEASKNNTQGLSMSWKRVPSASGSEVDAAGQGQPSQHSIMFTGSDGTTALAPIPTTDQDVAMLSLFQEVADLSSQQAVDNEKAQRTTNDIRSNNRNIPESVPAKNPTPLPVPNNEQAVREAVNLKAVQWAEKIREQEGQKGNNLSKEQFRDLVNTARNNILSQMNK